ncbi:MAG: hypothetical protein II054_03590 [Treponema sp.]|jgi:hypothetical protein|nr:hypothetical protein [Treponema sp.]MBR6295029.1 hypothetical protein [Treponema sp.]MEE3313267.1 hypothetical protein [Treponema sp.]
MKRGMALVLVALLSACFVFAEGSYVVKSVKGKVQYEAAPGKMQDVKVGQTLSSSTVVDTGLNSILVLTIDGKDLTIKAKQKGTVEKVAVGGGSGTLKKGGTVAGNASSSSSGSKSGVNTASSRASEAKEDVDWDEE